MIPLQTINQQAPEKLNVTDGKALEVHSIFHTIQGEGPNAGRPAIFVRLAGCNLQCPHCDTEYTQGRKIWDVERILDEIDTITVERKSTTLLVITGGEPFRQNIKPLVEAAINCGFDVQVETNGTLEPGFRLYRPDFQIVVSPKTGSLCKFFENPDVNMHIYYKMIVHSDHINPETGLPTKSLGKGTVWNPNRAKIRPVYVYLQPEDTRDPEQNARNTAACVKSALTFGHNVSLQLHKILDLP